MLIAKILCEERVYFLKVNEWQGGPRMIMLLVYLGSGEDPISKNCEHIKNQRGSQSHLVNTKVYKAKFSLVDVSVNAKKCY